MVREYREEFEQGAFDFLAFFFHEIILSEKYRPLFQAANGLELLKTQQHMAHDVTAIRGMLELLINHQVPSREEERLGHLMTYLARGNNATSEEQTTAPHHLWKLRTPRQFVGRDADVHWLTQRLSTPPPGDRISGVRGIGGIGKTALVGHVVTRLQQGGAFPAGIVVVNCSELHDVRDIWAEVAQSFGCQVDSPLGGEQLAHLMHETLRERDALVVLDDVQGEVRFTELVQPFAGTTPQIVVTSRLAFGAFPPEALWEVRELSSDHAVDLFRQCYGQPVDADEAALLPQLVAALYHHTLAVRLAGCYAAECQRDLGELLAELRADPLALPAEDQNRMVALILEKSLQNIERIHPLCRQIFTGLAAFGTPEFSREAAVALATYLDHQAPGFAIDRLIRYGLLEAASPHAGSVKVHQSRLHLHPLLYTLALQHFTQADGAQQQPLYSTICRY